MADKITFGATIQDAVTQRVYRKSRWADAWTLDTDLYCDEAVWTVAPSMPTATLHSFYGELAMEGDIAFSRVPKKDITRDYVKIEFGSGATLRRWIGIIEIEEDRMGGAIQVNESTMNATGDQTWTAYGLEHLLAKHVVRNSMLLGGTWVDRGITFNADGLPNETSLHGEIAFADDATNVVAWSSLDIIKYLLANQTPIDDVGLDVITFELAPGADLIIPSWDSPVLFQHHLTTYELLSSLLSRHRLMSWYLRVDDALDHVQLVPFTFNAEPVDFGFVGPPLSANTRTKHLVFDADASAGAVLKTSSVDRYDQFIVRGRRRRSCFTIGWADTTIEGGWSTAAKVAYDRGASLSTDYPAASELTARRKMNVEARSVEAVRDVYRRFAIPWDWDGKAGDGTGAAVKLPVFPIMDDVGVIADEPADYYPLELAIAPTLSLLEGVNYAGAAIALGTVDESDSPSGEERPPMVAWNVATSGTPQWQQIDQIGRKGEFETEDPGTNETWSADVSVVPGDRAVELVIHGQPQHIIASDEFLALPCDDTPDTYSFHDAIFTVCVEEDRFADGRYPKDSALDAMAERIVRKLVDAGDGFRLDYVVPNTAVDIDKDGKLVVSDGGFVHDDTAALTAIARIAFEWYGRDRQVLYFETEYVVGSSSIEIGDLITEIGDDSVPGGGNNTTINSVVTEIRVATPRNDGPSEPFPPQMSVTTGWGELDPLRLAAEHLPHVPIHAAARPPGMVDSDLGRRGG